MTALEELIGTLPNAFDLTSFFDPEVEIIESSTYPKEVVYKYYPEARLNFFQRPQMRFSPREALNDALELGRRWRETRAEALRAYTEHHLNIVIPAMFSNKDFLTSRLAQHLAENGQVLSPEQTIQINTFLESSLGQDFLKSQLESARQAAPLLTNAFFIILETELDRLLDETAAKSGILSLTEDHLSSQMWAHYAGQGKGFVVGLDAQHPFFFRTDGSNRRLLLRKIIYTDQQIENFWRNPYYFFLVKDSGWAYEKEWRVIKTLSDSDEIVRLSNSTIHLWNIAPEMIRSIHFGYNFDDREALRKIDQLLALGANPTFYKVSINRHARSLEEHLIQ